MTQGRKEIPPEEQLWELRKARDRYTALADQLRDDVDLLQRPDEKLARERDARRIAQAYEKSIQNMITSCRSRHLDMQASQSGSVAVKFAMAAFFVVAAGAVFVAVARPAILRIPMARIIGADAGVAAARGKSQNSVTDTAAQLPGPGAHPAMSALDVQRGANPHQAVRATPPITKAARAPQRRQSVKPAVKDADDGSHFVAKVLQLDGSLKEESFSTKPSR